MIKSLLLVLFFVMATFLVACSEETPEELNNFATCLTENGAEMYGLYNCGHCNDQKEMFGGAFEKVNYIECSVDQQKCAEKNIKGVPIWFLSINKFVFFGEQAMAMVGIFLLITWLINR